MNIVIRADASVEIGTGHIMRCLTLAENLIKYGAEITFICSNLPGNSISYIKDRGINIRVLEVDKNNLFVNTKKIIKSLDFTIDLLIIDHYEIDIKMEKYLKPFVKKIMVIDDLANRSHDCEILLDQNLYLNYRERYNSLVPSHCLKLLGPDYLLLRDEFILAMRNIKRSRANTMKNILVFFGGSDPTNETEKALIAIELLARKYHFNTQVVVGESNPNKNNIKSLCMSIPRVTFYCQVNNMAALMVQADISIGAGGVTTWERILLRLPTVVIITADNQEATASFLSSFNLIKLLGTSKEVNIMHLYETFENIILKKNNLSLSLEDNHIIDFETILNKPYISAIIKLLK